MSWQDAPVEKPKASWKDAPVEGKPEVVPTGLGGDGQNFLAGIGKGMADLGRGASQLVRSLGPQYAASADAFGLPNQADVDEAKRLDAPLMDTKAGFAGAVVGSAVPAVVTAPVAGPSVAGNALLGAALGGMQPVATGDSRLANTALGGAAGAGGAVVAKGIGKLAERATAARGATQAASAGRDAAAVAAKEAGYVLPPTQTNPSKLNSLLEGLSGKVKTAQAASTKNQNVTNALARKSIGAGDEALTKETLAAIRADAGQAYDQLARAGTFVADEQYVKSLADLQAPLKSFEKQFPGLANKEVGAVFEAVNQPSMDSGAVVEALKRFRFEGNANKASLDPAKKELGRVQTNVAKALEELVDRNLSASGRPDMLKQFQEARKLIAKTHTVEKALNEATGDVSAAKLAAAAAKGKPLSGELKTIADTATAFPKATQTLPQSYNALSPLDYAATTAAAVGSGGNPLALAGLVARPAARSLILSKAYQGSGLTAPSYSAPLSELLYSGPAQQGVRLGALNSPQLFQQK